MAATVDGAGQSLGLGVVDSRWVELMWLVHADSVSMVWPCTRPRFSSVGTTGCRSSTMSLGGIDDLRLGWNIGAAEPQSQGLLASM